MQRDLRQTALFQEAEALYRTSRQPGSGLISDALDAHPSPDGRFVMFTGTLLEKLEGSPPTRICQVERQSGSVRVMTFGPGRDRLPRYSPDGQWVAFLSDRHSAGNFQLYLLNPVSGAARATPHVQGWIEYLHWSPDGKRILLGVAGHGADIAGAQGAVTSKQLPEQLPSWMPRVETGEEQFRWRHAWIYELATDQVSKVDTVGWNVWEAAWCGNGALTAVVSPGPVEGLWYSAHLRHFNLSSGESRVLHSPKDQIGWPACSPSGSTAVIVDAICSDRWLVAGVPRLIDLKSGTSREIDTHGVDVICTEWRSERRLLLAGQRGFESVVGLYDAQDHTFTEIWSSNEITTAGRFICVAGVGSDGDCVLIGEGFLRAPEIAQIRRGQYETIRSLACGDEDILAAIAGIEQITWTSDDSQEIQGWLLRPKGTAPFPLVMYVHGGPVWHWRPVWLGRGASALMLVRRGFAVFLPNPRGSTGRGQAFARSVVGDMGGADARDYLTGLDHLVATGVADGSRLGVTGGSYGGFMTTWLITQDSRFAAAVALAPVTNQVTEHLLSNIPHFVSLFLNDDYRNPGGRYFERSPIMHAHRVRTPTLNICGALDRVTPPIEAVQFHNALLEHGVKSVLVTYPEEGHGVARFPANFDYAARVVSWFEEHLSPVGCT